MTCLKYTGCPAHPFITDLADFGPRQTVSFNPLSWEGHLLVYECRSFAGSKELAVWRGNRDHESLRRSRVEVWGEDDASKKNQSLSVRYFQETWGVGGKEILGIYIYYIQ